MRQLTIVIALIAIAQHGRPPESNQTTDELLDDLRSDDKATSAAAEQELHNRLNRLSDGLLVMLSETHTVEKNKAMQRKPVDRALAVLSRLDRQRFVLALMMNVRYFDYSASTKASLTAGHPFARMLCGMGPTAAYEIVKYLERPPAKADLSDEAIDMFARVFVTVYSSNGGIEEAQAMLTRAQRRAKNTEHIDRLQKAIREFGVKKPPPPPAPNVP